MMIRAAVVAVVVAIDVVVVIVVAASAAAVVVVAFPFLQLCDHHECVETHHIGRNHLDNPSSTLTPRLDKSA